MYAHHPHLSLPPAQAVLSPDVVELVVVEGESVSLTCTPSEEAMIVVNNINTNANSFQTAMAQRNDTGFYQCLTSSSVDSVYLLVACESRDMAIAVSTKVSPFVFQ